MTVSELTLVDGTLELLTAAIKGGPSLEALLDVSIAAGWEGFPEALPVLRERYASAPLGVTWGTLFFIEPSVPILVGFGGFKGPPRRDGVVDGVVEIGYCIAPAYRGRGLATQAVNQMCSRAFASSLVSAVDAHTLGHANPSTRVLEKAGFEKIAEQHDPDAGPIWQWRLLRPAP